MPAATLFGVFLHAFRTQAGLSQRALAASLHVAPATISRIETGRQNPPADPAFYERLRTVPGFSPSEVTLLREAHEADKYIWDLENLKGGGSKTTLDLARIEVAEDLALLGARVLVNIGKIEAHASDAVIEYIAERNRELPYGKLFLTQTGEVILMFELALPELIQPTMQAPQAVPPTIEEEAQGILTKFVQSGTSKYVSISSPMPPKPEVEPGDHLTKHVSDLQSEGKFGSEQKGRPLPYPHENVVFHVAHLRRETLSQQVPPAGSGVIRGHLMTLAEASQTSGIPVGTLRNYLHEGKLTARGREFASAPGGGKVLVDAKELRSLPRRPVGRPKKNPTTDVTNPS
jgi:transcriptional regulator with XRE-family HTH domain